MPTREEIKPRVIDKIKAVTDEDNLVENEGSDLQRDLGMGATLKKAMAVPYTKIAKSYPNGIRVSMSDAAACKTVKDSIDLVYKRSNGEE
jgi:hypothetical protein